MENANGKKRQPHTLKRVAVAFVIWVTWLCLLSHLTADNLVGRDCHNEDTFGEIHYDDRWQEAGISLPWQVP